MTFCEYDVDHGPMIEHVEGLGDVHTRDWRPCGKPASIKYDLGNGSYFWVCVEHYDDMENNPFKYPQAAIDRNIERHRNDPPSEDQAVCPAEGSANGDFE